MGSLNAVEGFVPGDGPDGPCVGMIVGESPGKNEVRSGKPFQGQAGKVLERALKEAGTSRDEYWITNAFKSRPVDANGKKRDPDDDELLAHGPYLRAELQTKQPKVVLLLGKRSSAMFGFLPQDEYLIVRVRHPANMPKDEEPEFQEAVDRFVKLAKSLR
jgi:uracil-DNA glycosylase family 4